MLQQHNQDIISHTDPHDSSLCWMYWAQPSSVHPVAQRTFPVGALRSCPTRGPWSGWCSGGVWDQSGGSSAPCSSTARTTSTWRRSVWGHTERFCERRRSADGHKMSEQQYSKHETRLPSIGSLGGDNRQHDAHYAPQDGENDQRQYGGAHCSCAGRWERWGLVTKTDGKIFNSDSFATTNHMTA